MAEKWFTSDVHLGHQSVLNFRPLTRQGTSTEEHDGTILRNWNRQVSPDDTVYILGDFSFASADAIKYWLDQLNGKKCLILGNHDKVIRSDYSIQKRFTWVKDYHEEAIGNRFVVMHHYPSLEWNGMIHGSYYLFGHVHGSYDMCPITLGGRSMDVGLDSRPNGIAPRNGPMSLWHWEEIDQILSKRPVRGPAPFLYRGPQTVVDNDYFKL